MIAKWHIINSLQEAHHYDYTWYAGSSPHGVQQNDRIVCVGKSRVLSLTTLKISKNLYCENEGLVWLKYRTGGMVQRTGFWFWFRLYTYIFNSLVATILLNRPDLTNLLPTIVVDPIPKLPPTHLLPHESRCKIFVWIVSQGIDFCCCSGLYTVYKWADGTYISPANQNSFLVFYS